MRTLGPAEEAGRGIGEPRQHIQPVEGVGQAERRLRPLAAGTPHIHLLVARPYHPDKAHARCEIPLNFGRHLQPVPARRDDLYRQVWREVERFRVLGRGSVAGSSYCQPSSGSASMSSTVMGPWPGTCSAQGAKEILRRPHTLPLVVRWGPRACHQYTSAASSSRTSSSSRSKLAKRSGAMAPDARAPRRAQPSSSGPCSQSS